MKICQINQPAGIGDIFFTQKIAHHYVDKYYKVIWPVREDLLWMNEYLISPGVIFTPPGAKITLNGKNRDPDVVLDIHNADQIFPNSSLLECKYQLVDMDYVDWACYFNFKRNIKKENELFYDILKLTDNCEYAFVSKFVGTPPINSSKPGDIQKDKVQLPDSGIPIVELSSYRGYNVLDWCKVLQNASEIHMVDTVFNYIIEKLVLRATIKKLYSRYDPADFSHIKNLFTADWEYIDL